MGKKIEIPDGLLFRICKIWNESKEGKVTIHTITRDQILEVLDVVI